MHSQQIQQAHNPNSLSLLSVRLHAYIGCGNYRCCRSCSRSRSTSKSSGRPKALVISRALLRNYCMKTATCVRRIKTRANSSTRASLQVVLVTQFLKEPHSAGGSCSYSVRPRTSPSTFFPIIRSLHESQCLPMDSVLGNQVSWISAEPLKRPTSDGGARFTTVL